mmetsp:Transcript_92009/g.192379  ORF Transcript_92009/g.192379 Transcript_92009/m.192379 type:complete len:98 (+) Transcript_92009:137-430(+)
MPNGWNVFWRTKDGAHPSYFFRPIPLGSPASTPATTINSTNNDFFTNISNTSNSIGSKKFFIINSSSNTNSASALCQQPPISTTPRDSRTSVQQQLQ